MQDTSGDQFDKAAGPKTDLCAGYHGGAETSAEAYSKISKSTRQAKQSAILAYIKGQAGGATCDEAEVALNMPHATCSARITDLKALGQVKAAPDIFRKTRSGCKAQVYFAVLTA